MELIYLQSSGGGFDYLLRIILALFFFAAVYSLIKGALKRINTVQSHGHHLFDTAPCSPLELYQLLAKEIRHKEIASLSITTVVYPEGGVFSANREYLRVSFRHYVFDICAAPFAKGFFISWWQGTLSDPLRDFLINLPFIGSIFRQRNKTFFEMDVETMFKESVSKVVTKVVAEVQEAKGIRQTKETNWNIYTKPY